MGTVRERTRRVLIVHNWHRTDKSSGENRTVEGDVALLRDGGVDVETYFRSNDEIEGFGPAGWAGMAVRPIVSPTDVRALRRVIERFRPDVMHLHNPLPLISPWVVRTARAAGVPVVQTVNNYLLVCVAGTFFRDGRPCHDCSGRAVPWPGVAHACYRDSRLQSAVLGASLTAHRSTWRLVDRFVAAGSAVARHLEVAGIDPGRISIRGNPVADPGSPTPPGAGALYVGRLSPEKGIELLLRAWERSGAGSQHRLRVAGGGQDRERIERISAGLAGVELLGGVAHQRALDLMAEAAFVVVPSLWEEPFGLAVVEAMARGRPVLVTDLGEPARIVTPESGWTVAPTIEAMSEGIRRAFASDLEPMGRAARERYQSGYSPAVALAKLLAVYDLVSGRRS